MLVRRTFLQCLPVAAVAAASWIVSRTQAADPPAFGGTGIAKGLDLRTQLEKGLKVQRPADFAYIKTVVNKVENGTLPLKLVQQAFIFASSSNSEYPFVYFQFTLKKLAAKAKVAI